MGPLQRAGASLNVPHERGSVSIARHRITADLVERSVPTALVDDVALVVSELLSNAVRHARPIPGDGLLVAWSPGVRGVRVAVTDGGSDTAPVAGHPPSSALGGRGLAIIDVLASAWGVVGEATGGTTVWVQLGEQDAPVG